MNNLNNNYPTLTNRTFGVELEFVGVHPRDVARAINNVDGIDCYYEGYHHRTTAYWKLVTDQSIDGTGGEIVSPILMGDEGARQLELVIAALDTIEGISVNVSCGLHVHLDVADLTVNEIQTTYERYADYESQIDMIMPRSRRGNNSRWCGSITNVKTRVKNVRTKSKAGLANAAGRYYKVNLQSLTRYGTMEFRQHSGTINFDKIINWVSFLMAFVEKSKKLNNVVKPQSKTRAFAKVRNAIENAGYNMEWDRTNRNWKIVSNRLSTTHTESLNITTYATCALENWEITPVYDGARETSLNEHRLASLMYANGLIAQSVVINTDAPVASFANNNEVDNGWLDGVDNKVKNFYQERQVELN